MIILSNVEELQQSARVLLWATTASDASGLDEAILDAPKSGELSPKETLASVLVGASLRRSYKFCSEAKPDTGVYLKLLSYMLDNRIDRTARLKGLLECRQKKSKKLTKVCGVWNHTFFPLAVVAACA